MILRRIVVVEQHCAPFNVKDTIRSAARDRREDTAVSTRETGAATQAEISALVLPNAEDCEVIRPDVTAQEETGCLVAARSFATTKSRRPFELTFTLV